GAPYWPLALFAAAMPWLPVPGHPPSTPGLLMGAALLATTAATHAAFFGEDRYHLVVTPVLALMAAAALRSTSSLGSTTAPWLRRTRRPAAP
ncbi:MAG: hypothetical protein ACRENE_10215, partial [Polyangiaceae bacterium]